MAVVTCDIDELGTLLKRVCQKGVDKIKEVNDEAMQYGIEKAFLTASNKIDENFKRIVKEDFYDKYTPHVYNKRAEDMGDVLQTEASGTTLTLSFDPGRMKQFERPASSTLMDLTLGLGYHGGAYSYTKHDAAGEYVHYPHYRIPVGVWSYWGYGAVQTESPYDLFVEWLKGYWEGEEFSADYLSEYHNKLFELASNILSA